MIKRTYRVSLPSSDSRLGGVRRCQRPFASTSTATDSLAQCGEKREVDMPPRQPIRSSRGTAATRICGCHFVDSTRSPYSATNSLVDWVR